MARFEQTFLKPGRYHVGGGVFRNLSADELAGYVQGTRRLLADGHGVPVLFEHADPSTDEGKPRSKRDERADQVRNNAGWLHSISVGQDGSAAYALDLTDPTAARKAQEKSIRYTSPELRDTWTDGKGRTYRNIISHVALTHKPRNPDQGNLRPTADRNHAGVLQFSLADLEPHPDKPEPPKPAAPKQTAVAIPAFTAGELAAILKCSQTCCDVEKGPSLLEIVTTHAKHSTDPRQRRRAMLTLLCGSLTSEESFRQVAAVLRYENVLSGDMPLFQDGWQFPSSLGNATRGANELRDLAMTALTAAAKLPESVLKQLAFSSDGESVAVDSDGDAMQFSSEIGDFSGYSQTGAAELSPEMAKLLVDQQERLQRNPNFSLHQQTAARKQVDQLVASGLKL